MVGFMATPTNYFPFKETSGTTLHDCIGQAQAQITNGTFEKNYFLDNSSVSLQSTSSISVAAPIGQFGTSDFALFLHVDISNDSYGNIIGNRTATSHGNFVFISKAADGKVHFEIDEEVNGKNYAHTDSCSPLSNGSHFIFAMRAGKVIYLYIDGRLMGTGRADGVANIGNGNALTIGGAQGGLNLPGIVGSVSTLAVWNEWPTDMTSMFTKVWGVAEDAGVKAMMLNHAALLNFRN